MDLYWWPFVKTFLISVTLCFLALCLLRRLPVSIHAPTMRFGGVALILAFSAGIAFDRHLVIDESLQVIVLGMAALVCFGIWDDMKRLPWFVQLGVQLAIAAGVVSAGITIHTLTIPLAGVWLFETGAAWWAGWILSVFWMVFFMNALNWIDGADGVLGSVAFVACLVIFGLSLTPHVNQPPVGILTLILAGAILGFLVFNIPPARLMAGTVGALVLGYWLSALSLFAGAKMATALLVLALPVADALWVVGERFRAGVSIFQGDTTRHLHYKLRFLGWSDRSIWLLYTGITCLIGLLALMTRSTGKLLTLLLVFGLAFAVLWWVESKVKLVAKHT